MGTDSIELSVRDLLLKIDNDDDSIKSSQEILRRFNDHDQLLEEIIGILDDESILNKNKICNTLAVVGFQIESFDILIPLLQKSLEYDARHKDTLMNLSIILAQFGETNIAIQYANQIEDKSEDVRDWLKKLDPQNNSVADNNILNLEQNDVEFTGERLVINKEVKENYNNVLEEHLHRYELACRYVQGKVVLDAACGAGYGSKMIQQAGAKYVLGVDISEESLQSAKKTYGSDNVNFGYGDVNNLKLDDESFDVVVSFETIEHIKSGARWIKESARVLKDDGIFLVSTPNRSVTNPGTYFIEQPLNPHHCYEYTVIEFVAELTKEYDVLELYGQTFTNDHESYFSQAMRQARKMDTQFIPGAGYSSRGHELVSLSEIKDAQPMYVLAVCRKKRKQQQTPVSQSKDRVEEISSKRVISQSQKSLFYQFGQNSTIWSDAEIVDAEAISIGDNVVIKKDSWLNIALNNFEGKPRIVINNGCQIGKNFSISVANKAVIEKHVIIGPNVYIADCGHVYDNIALPIMYQGVTSTTNEVVIGEGSWLGINSVIVGNVRIGKGCVIAANTFVNKDVPDFSVAAGNPAKIIKMFDPVTLNWEHVRNEKEVQFILQRRIDNPLISICIPTFNRAKDLEKCLESIYSEIGHHSLFEIYISNNDSSDHTEDIVMKYQAIFGNITYNKNEENIGADKNIALTMQKSKGRYMVMHGDDDFFKPDVIRKIVHSIISYRECGLFFLNVLNDNNEIKVLKGMNKFLEETSISSGFISSIIVSREEFDKLEDPFKFIDLAFNQIYLQYSILENNPNFCLINDSSFTYAGNEPLGYNLGEVFIKNYITILNYFKNRGLDVGLIQEDKKRILSTTIIPWFKRVYEFKLGTDISDFDKFFEEYYHEETYFEEVRTMILAIREQFS